MEDLLGHSTDGWSFSLLSDNGAIPKITQRYLGKYKGGHPLDPLKWASRSLIKWRLILRRIRRKSKFLKIAVTTQKNLPCLPFLNTGKPLALFITTSSSGWNCASWHWIINMKTSSSPLLQCSYQHPSLVTWEQTLTHSSLHLSGECLLENNQSVEILASILSKFHFVAARPTKSCLSRP